MKEASHIINTLRDARLEKAISQTELGDLLGVPQSQISRIETGEVDIRISTLFNMARALGKDIYVLDRHLFGGIGALVNRKPESTLLNRPAYTSEKEELEDD